MGLAYIPVHGSYGNDIHIFGVDPAARHGLQAFSHEKRNTSDFHVATQTFASAKTNMTMEKNNYDYYI